MCDPSRKCVVISAGSCCGLLIFLCLGGGISLYAAGPALELPAEVAVCVNETLTGDHHGFAKIMSKNGSCAELQDIYKQCEHAKAESKEAKKCADLKSQCSCSFAEHLSKLHAPSFHDSLRTCCRKVSEHVTEKVGKTLRSMHAGVFVGNISDCVRGMLEINGTAVQLCSQVVDNVAGELEMFTKACEKGNTADFHFPDGFERLMKQGDSSLVVPESKFAVMGHLVQKIHSNRPPGLNVTVVVVTLMMLVAAVSIGVRRARTNTAGSQAFVQLSKPVYHGDNLDTMFEEGRMVSPQMSCESHALE